MSLKFVKLKNPIEVKLERFILKGEFDCLKLGVTKSWLQYNFIEPDDVMAGETYETSPIWRYGNIELHFNGDRLFMIFTDYVDSMSGGKKINLDKWILEDKKKTKISDWVALFNENLVNYKIVHASELNQAKLILNEEKEGVVLTFHSPREESDPNHFELGAIQLWSSKIAFT